MPEFKKFLCLVIFLFNQSENNAVLEPRTAHFQGLVGFETKDFNMFPRGQGRPQGLYLWFIAFSENKHINLQYFSLIESYFLVIDHYYF